MIQTILLIFLAVLEVLAFGWLIIEATKSREQRETIIDVQNQILKLEKIIISMEKTIIRKLDNKDKTKSNKYTKKWKKH
jgi:hypothetical protein